MISYDRRGRPGAARPAAARSLVPVTDSPQLRPAEAAVDGQAADGLAVELPAIPASAGAMIFDRKHRLLILKPTYKNGWTIPGGVMEADGETPWDACRREVAEECGLQVSTARLACVDFRPPRNGKPGGLRFLFDCGVVDDARLDAIVLQPEEISEYRRVGLPEALTLLAGPVRRRVKAGSTSKKKCRYLENGRPVPGVR
jgi:8-oxo-dGTP diphosphatase